MSNVAGHRARSKLKGPSREMVAWAEEARAAEVAKTARLRGLRLAKEAADRAAAQQAPPAVLDAGVMPRRRPVKTASRAP